MNKTPSNPLGQLAHPIQVVARRTGLSADVIRVWEQRYQAVVPQRSATNRRLYSNEDIERLALLRQATQAGRRIGDVARLALAELQALVKMDQTALEQLASAPAARAEGDDRRLEACLTAVQRLEPRALEVALIEAARALSRPVLLNEVIGALLKEIGERWRSGELRTCHEHMATAVLRSFLGNLILSSNMAGSGPCLVVTTPVGQSHELGAVMAAVTAALGGWDPLYLGPDVPSDEIAFAAVSREAKAVALSVSYPADDPRLPEVLRRLRRQLPEEKALLIGGAGAVGYREVVDEIGARHLDDLEALRQELDRLRAG